MAVREDGDGLVVRRLGVAGDAAHRGGVLRLRPGDRARRRSLRHRRDRVERPRRDHLRHRAADADHLHRRADAPRLRQRALDAGRLRAGRHLHGHDAGASGRGYSRVGAVDPRHGRRAADPAHAEPAADPLGLDTPHQRVRLAARPGGRRQPGRDDRRLRPPARALERLPEPLPRRTLRGLRPQGGRLRPHRGRGGDDPARARTRCSAISRRHRPSRPIPPAVSCSRPPTRTHPSPMRPAATSSSCCGRRRPPRAVRRATRSARSTRSPALRTSSRPSTPVEGTRPALVGWAPPPAPVVFVHGFLGSRLRCGADVQWPGTTLGGLSLAADGTTEAGCGATLDGVVDTVFGKDIYGSTLDFLGQAAPGSVYPLAWDWRKSPQQSLAALDALIDQARADHPGQKVAILAHSMGGLLTRWYLDDAGAGGQGRPRPDRRDAVLGRAQVAVPARHRPGDARCVQRPRRRARRRRPQGLRAQPRRRLLPLPEREVRDLADRRGPHAVRARHRREAPGLRRDRPVRQRGRCWPTRCRSTRTCSTAGRPTASTCAPSSGPASTRSSASTCGRTPTPPSCASATATRPSRPAARRRGRPAPTTRSARTSRSTTSAASRTSRWRATPR